MTAGKEGKPAGSCDPLLRTLVLLRLIPRHPSSISTVRLHAALAAEGFEISLRSLQRDLDGKLSQHFDLLCSKDDPDPAIARQRPFRWSYQPHVRPGLPLMSAAEAMAFQLCEGHLRHLLPPGVLDQLEPHFAEARQTLSRREGSKHARWLDRVRSLPNGKALLPAVVPADIWEKVATAVLEQRQLQVDYFSRAKGEVKPMRLHPKGLVSRGPTTYLIASVGDYRDVRHFALHRIRAAKIFDEISRHDEFQMSEYLPMAAFTRRHAEDTLQLTAEIHQSVAGILQETPISSDQTLVKKEGETWYELHATMHNDEETIWWLLSLGEEIKVVNPESLRSQISEKLCAARKLYFDKHKQIK